MNMEESIRLMKKNVAPILAVAFAMAVVCTAAFYGLVAGKLTPSAEANATPNVLVAARQIARGSTVSALDVKALPWTSGPVPEDALQQPSQVDGMTALTDVGAGEPLVSARLANRRTGGGLGIPSGMRAVSVQVHDSSGIVALLKAGHRVDVQAVYTRTGANQDAELKTVLENVEVLKINPVPEPAPGRSALPVATLLVTPAEADVVGLADAVARVRLVLRNPLDQEKVPRQTLAAGGLMRGGYAQSVAGVPLPPRIASFVSIPAPAPLGRPASALSLGTTADPAACNPPKTESAAAAK